MTQKKAAKAPPSGRVSFSFVANLTKRFLISSLLINAIQALMTAQQKKDADIASK
jgi:hypothetical protein